MNKVITAIRSFWAGLPHQAQALIILFLTAAGTTLGKELSALAVGDAAFTWLSLKKDIGAAILAGVVSVRAFYLLPNGMGKPPAPPAPPSPDHV